MPQTSKTILWHRLSNVTVEGTIDSSGGFVVTRIQLGTGPVCPKTFRSGRHPEIKCCTKLIARFLDGKKCDLFAVPICYDGFSEFRRQVSEAARRIPGGTTVSYRELAGMAGRPGAVRAVASVMRNNPFPLVVPCHRVIRSDGTIGGFGGKLRGKQIDLKRRLLRLEGVDI